MNKGLLSSEHMDYETPQDFFDELNKEFGFDLDVCALPDTAKCDRFFTPGDDGLVQPWNGVCWMNPPYGRQIGRWIQKAFEESQKGALVVCLIPSRTDTGYWHEYVMKGEVRFIKGRLYFSRGGQVGRAPFPSAVVIFWPPCRTTLGTF